MTRNFVLKILVIFYCFSPFLNLVFTNLIELEKNSFYDLVQPFFFFLFISVLIYIFDKKIEKKDLFYGFFVIHFIFVFYFKEAFNSISIDSLYLRLLILVLVYFLINSIIFYWYKIKKLTNILILSLGLITIYNLGLWSINAIAHFKYYKTNDIQSININTKNITTTKNNFNVYYIIADGLTDKKNFSRITRKNLKIYDELESYGFINIDGSRSNYIGSASSIASIFHLDYFRDYTSDLTTPSPNKYYPRIMYSEKSSLMSILTDRNYNFKYFPAWYTSCPPNKSYECIESSFKLNKFSLKLFDNSFLSYLENKWLGSKFHYIIRREVDALKNFNEYILNNSYGNNNFFFVHNMQPHDPYFFNSECKHINTSNNSDRLNYYNSVQCLTKNLLHTVQIITNKDPNGFIVIQGDHGWNLKTDAKLLNDAEYYDYRTRITNLIKGNDKCNPQNFLKSPLSTARFIVSCIENIPYNKLEELTYIPDTNYSETGKLKIFSRN